MHLPAKNEERIWKVGMNGLKNWLHKHKKQVITSGVILAVILCVGIAVAFMLGGRDGVRGFEKGQVEIDFSVEDLAGIVTGLEEETYVLAGSTLDLLSLLSYDDAIVIKATADELDLSVAANLEAKYTFTVNAKALCALLGREFPENGMAESVIVASKKIIVVDPSTAQSLEDAGTAVYRGTEAAGAIPNDETTTSGHAPTPGSSQNSTTSSEAAGNGGNIGQGTPETGNGSQGPSSQTGNGATPHVHTWVYVSPENSWHMEYGAECRMHGYNGEEPMFFRSQNDLFLHHAADGCTSSWGTGFKGLAYRYCSGCGEEVVTGHVHDFGTIAKEVYFEKVVCECGMSFSAGKDYTALESWNTHVEIYTSNGAPREEHDSYQTVKTSVTRYEATKACSCGWRPVDNRPVY